MNLPSLKATLDANRGVLQLPLIKNKKTINPRDSDTPAVFQLETAMGSAIECFDDAGAVVVPRDRFAPVKTCNDLFALRSDVYEVCFCGRAPMQSLGVILHGVHLSNLIVPPPVCELLFNFCDNLLQLGHICQ